jgi:hypothetical protein
MAASADDLDTFDPPEASGSGSPWVVVSGCGFALNRELELSRAGLWRFFVSASAAGRGSKNMVRSAAKMKRQCTWVSENDIYLYIYMNESDGCF